MKKKILFVLFGMITIIKLIFFVPFNLIWGPERNIDNIVYAPIWSTYEKRYEHNGFTVFYDIYFEKAIYEIVIINIILFILFFLYKTLVHDN